MRILDYFNVWKQPKLEPIQFESKAVFINKEVAGDSCTTSMITSIKAKRIFVNECHKDKTIYVELTFGDADSLDVMKIPIDNKFSLTLLTPHTTLQISDARVNGRVYTSDFGGEWMVSVDAAFPEAK